MPNKFCKPEDVAKSFIECVHKTMDECYPNLEKDSPEYNKIATKLLCQVTAYPSCTCCHAWSVRFWE